MGKNTNNKMNYKIKNKAVLTSGILLLYILLMAGCGKPEASQRDSEGAAQDMVSESISADTADEDGTGAAVSGNGTEDTDSGDENHIDINETSNDSQSDDTERTIQSAIMDGDFSSMDESDLKEYIIRMYQEWEENETIETKEWRQLDLNGDGIDDLILQDRESVGPTQIFRIVAIFACEENNARCMLWDVNDSSEYSFCGVTGELMYSAPYSGTAIAGEPYRHYYYDSEWNKIEDYLLVRTTVDSSMDGSWEEFLQYHQRFLEANPDMAEDGEYFSRYEIDIETGEQGEREALSYEEFKEIFEDVMEIEYIRLNP